MMMAYDSSPTPPPGLSDTTIARVRASLDRFAGEPVETTELRDSLCKMAREARQKRIRAEQVLIALKEIWYALPAVQQAGEPKTQFQALQRLVTLCIKEYYAEREKD